jgi:hypothetical protein
LNYLAFPSHNDKEKNFSFTFSIDNALPYHLPRGADHSYHTFFLLLCFDSTRPKKRDGEGLVAMVLTTQGKCGELGTRCSCDLRQSSGWVGEMLLRGEVQ